MSTVAKQPALVVTCPKCGEPNPPGEMHCAKCRSTLRPAGLVGIMLLGLLNFATLVLLKALDGDVGWTGQSIYATAACMTVIAAWAAAVLAMSQGRRWAWVVVQAILILVLAWLTMLSVVGWNTFVADYEEYILLASAGFVAFQMYYVRTENVRGFCAEKA